MNRKIRKLTEMIEGAKKEARELEDKLEAAKAKLDAGRINKAEFSKVRMQLSESIKGKRTVNIAVPAGTSLEIHDQNDNATPLKEKDGADFAYSIPGVSRGSRHATWAGSSRIPAC